MGLATLILGLIVMLGAHVFVTFRGARAGAIQRLGQNGYWALFSIVSVAGFALIVWGYGQYRAHEWVDVWSPPAVMRHVTVSLMLVASILLPAAAIPSHIKAKARYPMLAAIKIWAFAHLLSNGDLGSILLFGGFLVWAVYGRVAAKWRGDGGAVVAPAGWRNDVLVVAIGIVIFLALGYLFHPFAIGIPVFGR